MRDNGQATETAQVTRSLSGVWPDRDPIAEKADLNLYRFNYNDPINYVDHDGLWGIWFRDFHIGCGDPNLVFDSDSWNDVGQGAAATADGLIPFFGPFKDKYDPCDPIFACRYAGGEIAQNALLTAAGLRVASWLRETRLCHGLNHNPYLRIGPGRVPRNGPSPPSSGAPRIGFLRFYEPNLQRWINGDPIAEGGFERVRTGGLRSTGRVKLALLPETSNSYEFVNNNPANVTDSLGLATHDELMRQALQDMDYWARVMREYPPGSPIYKAAQIARQRAAQQYGAISLAASGAAGMGAYACTIGGSSALPVLSGSAYGFGAAAAGWSAVGLVAGAGAAVGYGTSQIPVIGGGNVAEFWGDALYGIAPGFWDWLFR
jgi:RHS repeat-associated protein